MIKLFDEKERFNFDFAKNQHNSYDFYNDTSKEEFVEVREKLEDWFSRYPDSAKKQLRRDMQNQFDSAFFELFIHELFYQQGFSLTVHPALPGSSKNPDFLAKKGDVELYLEAKTVFDESTEEQTLKNKQNAIFDAINEVKSDYLGVCVNTVDFLTKNQPKLSHIKDFFKKQIDEKMNKWQGTDVDWNYFDDEILYETKHIRIEAEIIRSSVKLNNTMFGYPPNAFVGGCEESIRKAIKEKAYKYGDVDKPFIICINSLSSKFTRTEDVYKALFGCNRNVLYENLENLNQEFKTSCDGLFDLTSKFSCGSISGVFITTVNLGNFHVARHWLVKHPHTKNEFDMNNLELDYIHVNNDRIEEVKRGSIGDL
ncbi:hypothetical protein [Emticicia fluvialis]|uniref:hypothetical protein n=1 Tax=Emticicia fluvialis TaxID=2974474 RepID=UPI002164F15C|nr:hypothetical protein [Emticicia fluvialis]